MLNFLFLIIFSFTAILSKQNNISLQEFKEPNGGPLSCEFLKLLKKISKVNTFIETGTFIGKTTLNASKVFDKVFTVELSKDIFDIALKNFSGKKNITAYCGDSSIVLPKIFSENPEPLILWLDGHYSGIHFGIQTAVGEKNVPILEELYAVKKSNNKNVIILIDDIRLFDKTIKIWEEDPFFGQEAHLILGGYPSIQDITSILYDIDPTYKIFILGDILLAYPSHIPITVSPIINACTTSRLCSSSSSSSSSKEDCVYAQEEKIIYCNDSESQVINNLYNWFCQNKFAEEDGIGKHYILWKALCCLGRNDFEKSSFLLKKLKANKLFSENRINYYLRKIG